MLNNLSAFAARAGQRILGNQNEDATDNQEHSSVSSSSSGSTVNSSDDIEGTLENQSPTENPPLENPPSENPPSENLPSENPASSEEGQSHGPDQQPDEIEQHYEENQNPVGVDQLYGEGRELEEDEDSGSESRAQASAFNRIFEGAQGADHSVRDTPPSIEGYVYRDQLPPYSSKPASRDIVIQNVEDGTRVAEEGVGDMSAGTESQNQQTHEGHDEQIPPPLYVPSTLDQELLRVNDPNAEGLPNNSLDAISNTGTDDVGGISANEQVPDEGRADPTQAPSQTTPDELAEEQEVSERSSQNYSPASALGGSADSPPGGDVGKDKEDTDQTSTVSLPCLNTSGLTLVQRRILEINGEDVPATDKEEPEPPSSPSASSQDFHSRPDPIFVPRSNAKNDSFVPFFKGGLQRPGDTRTDVIIRDQIGRSEAARGRLLTDAEKEVIRSFFRDMDRPRAPDEVSEPTIIHSPGALAEVEKSMVFDYVSNASGSNPDFESGMSPSIQPTVYQAEIEELRDEFRRLNDTIEALTSRLEEVEGRVDSDKQQLLTALDKRTANLFRKIGEIEACQDNAEKQLKHSQEQLHAVGADIAQFQAEKQATQEKLGKLEKELQTVKDELHNKSKAEVDSKSTTELDTANKVELSRKGTKELDGPNKAQLDSKSTNEFDNKSNELDTKSKAHTTTARSYGPDPHLAESTQPPARWFQLTIGVNSSYVVFAMTVLVWLVTEGMLHSKRLSDGYGPFINGGYNGLGSVVIFGTWPKFFLFYVVAVYLGVVSIKAAVN